MKIILERKWKKGEYTIGELWIDGERMCNTLEPKDRGLKNEAVVGRIASEEWISAQSTAKAVKASNPRGTTAIPTGFYRVTSAISTHFNARRLFLRDVPGFVGIMIHEGNTKKNTTGCILVGENTAKGCLTKSQYWLKKINDKVFDAIDAKETVIIKIM